MMVAAELKENTVPIRPMMNTNVRRQVRTTYRPKIGKKAVENVEPWSHSCSYEKIR
jgi:hypothetical protein